MSPRNPAIEARDGGYYVAGTRVSLDSVAWALRRGENPARILAELPAIGSMDLLGEAIRFVEGNPEWIEEYLSAQSARYERLRRSNPESLARKARNFRAEAARKPA